MNDLDVTTSESFGDDGDIPDDTIAVVLAAGAGTRFTGPTHKLLARIGAHGETTVVESSLTNVLEAGFTQVVVVTGAISLPEALLQDPRLVPVHNKGWADGQATSLKTGIDTARRLGATSVVIGLGDQPFIAPAAWRRVAQTNSPIAVASYAGHRGHPVKLASSVWDEIATKGDVGARDLIRMHPDQVSQVDCPGSSTDIDTQEDLAKWT